MFLSVWTVKSASEDPIATTKTVECYEYSLMHSSIRSKNIRRNESSAVREAFVVTSSSNELRLSKSDDWGEGGSGGERITLCHDDFKQVVCNTVEFYRRVYDFHLP